MSHFFHGEREGGFNETIFCLEGFFPLSHCFCQRTDVLFRQGQNDFCFTRNGVAHVAAFPRHEAGFKVGNGVLHQTSHGFVGVAAADLDLTAGVTAEETGKRDFHGSVGSVRLHFFIFQSGSQVHAAGGADDHFAFILVVEVEEDFAFEDIGFHVVHAPHGGFLVGSDEAFNRTVRQRVVLHDCHDGGDSHSVVSTEGGVASTHPFAVNVGLNRVVLKVVRTVWSLLRHHVHVSLEGDILSVFHAGRGRFAHDDVAGFVLEGGDTFFFCPVKQELLHLLEMTGGAGNLCQQIKVFPNSLRLKICNFTHNIGLSVRLKNSVLSRW